MAEGRYTRIKSKFWTDEKARKWDSETKYLALYLLTSPHNNILGCFVLPKLYICADLGWDIKQLDKPFNSLLEDDFIKYDDDNCLLFLCNYLKHNPIENGNQATGAIKQLGELPKSPILQCLKASIEQLNKPFLKELAEQIAKPVTVTVTVTTTVTNICAPEGDAIDNQQKFENNFQTNDKPRGPFKNKQQEQLFDKYWEVYPKKKSKGDAEKAWVKISPDDLLFRKIINAVDNGRASPEWKKDQGKFIPYPASWLNAKGWEDEYSPLAGEEESHVYPNTW